MKLYGMQITKQKEMAQPLRTLPALPEGREGMEPGRTLQTMATFLKLGKWGIFVLWGSLLCPYFTYSYLYYVVHLKTRLKEGNCE